MAPKQLAHQANGVADILLGDAEKGGGLMKGDRREVHSSSPPSLTAAFLTKNPNFRSFAVEYALGCVPAVSREIDIR
ncbi:hypothetical protein Q1M64_21370 [Sinorhizobium meliloti]|nr:hypothetical protein Q1M64_21370 [Sinorhizobium meliloti]